VRLARYVLAELALVASALVGAGAVSQRVVSTVHDQWAARGERLRFEATVLPPRGDISDPPEPIVSDEATGTFLGMSDELLLDRVRSQPIVRVKMNRGGSSLSFRIEFADGSRAAFKPAQTNLQTVPRKEVAAYRLNRLLGLNAVPPAAPRMVAREELLAKMDPGTMWALPRVRAETLFDTLGKTAGVVMYWLPEIKESGLDTPAGQQQTSAWLTQGSPIPLDKRPLAAQVSDLAVFDFLTSNPDRYSGGNMKTSPDGSRLYFMDNTMAFFLDGQGNGVTRPVLIRTQRFSRRLYHALERLSVPSIEGVLAEERDSPTQLLTAGEIRAVVTRRDVAKKHIEDLITMYGEQKVLVFP